MTKIVRLAFGVKLIATVFLGALLPTSAQQIVSLGDALQSQEVRLQGVSGDGNSTGTVLHGYLVNQTGTTKQIAVTISPPLFLVNHGVGQDMLATEVYEDQGTLAYFPNDNDPYIELPPWSNLRITFKAYCVDFEKDNPSRSEQFVVRQLPPTITRIARQISLQDKTAQNTGQNNMSALQVALWMAQGVSQEDILARYPATPADVALAHMIIQRSRDY